MPQPSTFNSEPMPASAAPSKLPNEAPANVDAELERALEGLFRLGANRRFNLRQTTSVGAAVTRAGYAALRSLHDHGTLSIRRLADACAMDAATASRQLMPLVDEGLVERRSADGDARQAELSLTPRGREIYERIVEYRLDQLTSVLDAWPEEDRAALTALVTRLVRDLARLPRASAPSPRRAQPVELS
jgi:DNA-binding MarR family transcriptional regulator